MMVDFEDPKNQAFLILDFKEEMDISPSGCEP